MFRFLKRSIASLGAVLVSIALTTGFSADVSAADENVDVEALQAQLEEAKKLLEQDKAAHEEMAEKKRLIDEKLAERKAAEAKIFEEMNQLCKEQDKLKPGSLDACMAKLDN